MKKKSVLTIKGVANGKSETETENFSDLIEKHIV